MATATAAPKVAKPNCRDRCGDVEIPYPFGITEDCYLNDYFSVTRNESGSSGQPQTLIGKNLDVPNIFVHAHQCFPNSSGILGHADIAFLRSPTITISHTQNKFVVVGCDTYAFLNAFQNNEPFSIGCTSTCQSMRNVINGSCSGIGCCQLEIPKGLKNFTLEARSYYNHTTVQSFNPCSYAFVAKQGQFNFSSNYLESLQNVSTNPMVLDWAIGHETCEDAQRESDYICRGNSACYDPDNNGYGYTGTCMETTRIFSAEELEKVLCQGGYRTVYKGVLPDNKVVVIKKSKICDQSQIKQFINELIVLTQISHRNVVKLLGYCLETKFPLLVYEFITNGTLFYYIHNKSLSSSFSWETHLKIASEIAGELAFLHSATSMPIIHRDVKTANILLDENYSAKMPDFGASRLVLLDHTHIATLVQGTFGYLDPEHFHTSQLTEKGDIYSFGVVVAELLTGKKALSFDRPESDRNLAMYFSSVIKEDCIIEIIDDHIVSEGSIEEVKEVANLAKRCLRLKGEERPTMKELAMEHEGLRITEKHRWGKPEYLYIEETEQLLSADIFSLDVGNGYSSSTRPTSKYESMKDQVLQALDDGR
ncbi:hypothetical protein I3842_06G033100 [Carya illinoinensis]|uniref:Protein kinase domain-containing protein n=1 Tax=Carya illinoinensis TaxID=32201 RepID=A0A922JHE3_CARIL|nr:hypothetical protein I3842_06G033100 [Carya illinoinensis]